MIHKPDQILNDIAVRMATKLRPELATEFTQADTDILMGMVATLAQDYDRAAYNLDADIREIKQLFEISPPDEARSAYVQDEPISIRLSDLTEFHARGLSLLIELHSWAEAQDDELNRAIWRFLRDASERHKFELPSA